ncbi:DUF2887 domain-containing protein [Pseudanabaena sp. PCC 6802]|uniref:DUF2887 domain-containing protein n=1 Tax=Pseudanabaena sp. PCC 6802 TaxID=118173 RepID=UPI000344F596|nr:DUF2887 domain-containing protein [Pseudanabaena sp. PCC 6802]
MAELVVADREAAIAQAKQLTQQMQEDSSSSGFEEGLLKLIQAVIVYKLEYNGLQDLQATFALDDVRKTRLFIVSYPYYWSELILIGNQL